MKKIAIMARPDETSESLKQMTLSNLQDHGFILDEEHPEIVIVIGGDGTFIYAIHKYIDLLDQVHFFGLHTGTLGFYTEYEEKDFNEFIHALIHEEYSEKLYPMLEAKFGDAIEYGLNEIRIENIRKTQALEVYIDNKYFEDYRGTGMSVCTQIGSTAYNRSLGGAVLYDELNCIELVEIAGIHHSKARSLHAPFVLPGDCRITFKTDDFEGAILGCDSDVYHLDDIREVEISMSQSHVVKMYKGKHVDYFKKIQSLF